MNPFYMNRETRDSLIAESKRLIAERAANAAVRRNSSGGAAVSQTSPPLASASDDEAQADGVEENSAFAVLVSELWSASSKGNGSQSEGTVAR
ncbi:MAG: hypothetical protein ABI641_03540 [Caldimonas sp.]